MYYTFTCNLFVSCKNVLKDSLIDVDCALLCILTQNLKQQAKSKFYVNVFCLLNVVQVPGICR